MTRKCFLVLVVIIGVILLIKFKMVDSQNNADSVLKLELSKCTVNYRYIKIFSYNDKIYTLVIYRKSGHKYILLHKYSKYEKDKIIFLLPNYKVITINRKNLILRYDEGKFIKAID